ncbi:hypothetical protein CRE_18130 [Caenorhabditis remanei]|uniref:BTB domain-containing protein n=1 Tax=Caenorhabditis remanei TaxID=31234 RepID=E3N331_CAERE|nr:hypothetical protein CRE_18130 [Caenorhabditis remanei]
MSKKAAENEEKRINNTLSEWTVEKFLDMRKEVLDRQKDLEKSNMEMVEKLRLYDEKIEKLEKELQPKLNETDKTLKPEISSEMEENNDSAVTTDPVDSTQDFQENDEEMMSTSGKYFVLKHTFNNVSSFKDGTYYFSEKEEHFGFPWRICVIRCDGFLGLYLCHLLLENTEKKWEIEVDYEMKIMSPSSREKKEKSGGKGCFVFKMKVKKMTGIYKENLRSFNKTMEEYSDVVLIVNDQKFYVLKLYIATHSPYFKNLFSGISNETENTEIKLYGIDADDFQKYLEVIYGEQAIDEFTVEAILMVADKYDTPVVIEKCENFLKEKSEKTLKKKLELSNRYNLVAFTENKEMMSTSGKHFVLKHTFNKVSSFEDEKLYRSEEEEHFGVPWRIIVRRHDGFLGLHLCHLLLENTEKKWEIEVEYEMKIVSPSSGEKKEKSKGKICKVFKSDATFTASGYPQFIEWDELEKDFVVDDCFCAEIAVKVKKMTGIYKENMRIFNKTMEECSDVVLIVNDQKFYVLKSFLSTHSPYFKTLFMRKLNEANKIEIKLSGIDADDFQKYLEVLYGEQAIDEFTVEGILMVADKYDTRVVIEKCKNFLQYESEKTLKKKLELSTRYNLAALMKECLEEIESVSDIKSLIPGDVHDLNPSIMAELFQKSLSLHNSN